jgi:putative NADH-flavin reductase
MKELREMRLVLFGAIGAYGKQLLEQALRAGDEVTAVVRSPGKLPHPTPEGLEVVTADIMDANAIAPPIAGSDAVISALGGDGREPTTVMTEGAHSIIKTMRAVGARRLIVISGSFVDDTGDGPLLRYLGKPLARRIFRGAYEDMLAAEHEVHESELAWTILRPPRLTDKPASGRYRTALDRNLPHAYTLSRADLAASTLAIVDDTRTIGRHVFVAS